MCQKYWRIHNAYLNTENTHRYLQHKIKQIIKYWYPLKMLQMHEITASHENCGGCLKFRRKTQAEICCGKLLRKIAAENCCGRLLRKTPAENCCGKLLRKIAAEICCGHTKFMRLIIYDRTKADVEISAPGKIPAPAKLLRL